MENKKIRVNTGVKIEVNDSGDVIVARLDDNQFISKFYDIVDVMENVSGYMKSEEMKGKEGREQLAAITEKTKDIMAEIDNLFGANSCKKVFGDIVPSGYALADFFDQLIPIFEEFADERQKSISAKYNRSRKGHQ